MSRFAVRCTAAALLLCLIAAVPPWLHYAERRRQLAPFQGDWIDADTGRPVTIRGAAMTFAAYAGIDGADCTIGAVDLSCDPPRLVLTVPVSGHPGERATVYCIFRAEPGRVVVEQGVQYPTKFRDPPRGFTLLRR